MKLLATSFAIVLYGLLMCVTLKVSTYAASTVRGGRWRVICSDDDGDGVSSAVSAAKVFFSFFLAISEFVWESVTNRPQAVKNCMETGQKVKIFYLQKCMRPV